MDVQQTMGFAHFLQQTDGLGKTVFAVLLVMSVATWYLIIIKTLQTWLARRRTMRFLEAFWDAPSLQAVAADLEEQHRPEEPFSHLAWHAIVAARHHQRHGANKLNEAGSATEFLTRSMRRVIDEETARLETGLTVLASVGSTAPFVGLFGTVWGIYHALVNIGMSGQGTLDKVAGPVGEALIMTAAGLAVAVPAVLAYNAFVRGNRMVLAKLDSFAHDLFAFLTTGSHVYEVAAVLPLRDKYRLEVAFGMADALAIQQGIARLEARGAQDRRRPALRERGELVWPHRANPRTHGRRARAACRGSCSRTSWRRPQHGVLAYPDCVATFALSTQDLAEAREMDAVLVERTKALSRAPQREDVLILAHGTGDDAENERWMAYLDARADAVRKSAPYRRVQVETLREDWPVKRKEAERRTRDFVKRASASGGNAIVIPYRVQGFGPYARVLRDLDYVSDGQGLLPHPNVAMWIEQQIKTLKAGPFREPAGAGGRSQARDHASSVAGAGVPKENSP